MSELGDSGEAAAKEETGISLEELNKIAAQINNTPPDSRGNIAHAEFGWLYIPGQPQTRYHEPEDGTGGQAQQTGGCAD